VKAKCGLADQLNGNIELHASSFQLPPEVGRQFVLLRVIRFEQIALTASQLERLPRESGCARRRSGVRSAVAPYVVGYDTEEDMRSVIPLCRDSDLLEV
jgi:hypothetical protein